MNPTSPWRVMLTEKIAENGIIILQTAAQVDDYTGIQAAELQSLIPPYDALIVRGRTSVTADLLAAAPRLKVVGRAGVGVDNVDLAAARLRGVKVVNTPTATSLTVAELTIGLMFALARAIPRADAAMKRGQWQKKTLAGIELWGKTLGVIGMGKIGTAVTQRAAALGMDVIGCDAFLSAEEILRKSGRPLSLAELYAQADFISLHIPLTPQTRNMIDRRALAQMKPGVRLISTARGGIIDEAALIESLESGQVAGAALDVFAQEPPGISPLICHPAVVATPHIGAQTREAQARAAADIAHEVLAALRDEPLRWQVA